MKFSIEYDKQPKIFLKKLDKHLAERILDRVDECLKNEPAPHNAKPIVGKHGVFRLRISDYRTLYRINYKKKQNSYF